MQLPLGRDSAPHGVIIGPDRAAWITDGGQNAIARVDPLTRAVKLFPLPKDFPDANLNTATFDRKGILWFTGQNGVYGRVDPATGKVEAWKAPKGVGPYGIATTPNGEVWYASLAGDHIAKIDTVSGDAHDGGAAQARRRPAPHLVGLQGHVVGELLEHRRGRPLRSDRQDLESSGRCRTAATAAMRSMSTRTTRSGSATGPTTPSSVSIRRREKFESFPSNRRGAAVRQLLGRPGEVWGAESGTDRLVMVRD